MIAKGRRMPGFLGRVVGQAREWSCSWLISVGVGLLLCWTVGLAAGAEKPNILFVAIDDQNDWIGCLGGHPRVQTPHIDALAQRGTLFLNAHCQSPLCNPSRTSVLTGRRPESTGIYGLSPWFRDVDDLKTLQTLPRYLQQHGYSTHSAGKIFHGNYGRGPREPEFEQLGPSRGVGIRPPQKLGQTPAAHPLVDWGVFPHQDEEKGDWQLASWTVEQIESGRLEEPFFL